MKHLSQYITEKYNIVPVIEGGASGHMLHPYDVDEFTGYDIEELIRTMFGGKMEGMTEKMDGFGMQASMNGNGEVVFIRNKTNLNSEKGGMTLDDFTTQWANNPKALDNYTRGGKIIEVVFKKVGKDWFNPNVTTRRVVNCECILAGTTNTIPYASDQVDFHNIWVYEKQESDGEWKNTEVTKRGLDVIEKACEGIDNAKITPQVIIKYSEETVRLEKKWLDAWDKFIKKYDCSPEVTIEGIKYSLFYKYIEDNYPWIMDDRKSSMDLCRRWLFGDKSTSWKTLKAIYQDHENELTAIDKKSSKLVNDVLEPLQLFFYGLGADLIKITQGFINQGQDQTVKSLLKDLQTATDKIKREGSLEDNEFLQKWLDVLDEIGRENLVSAEGIVFSYKGKMMKWTGGFVPLNRIIGYSKYNMKPKTLVESLFDLDTTQTMESLFDKDLIPRKIDEYHPKTIKSLVDLIIKELDRQGPDADLNIIDVSKMTSLKGVFEDVQTAVRARVKPRNIDVSKWDTHNVTNMDWVFKSCKDLNCDVSQWNTSKVKSMRCMFFGCTNFNSDLSKWDVSNVKDMAYMFSKCTKFNSDLSKWDVSNVETMVNEFAHCDSLKKIPSWYHEES